MKKLILSTALLLGISSANISAGKLYNAVENGNLEEVIRLVTNGAEVNTKQKFLQDTPLHIAAINGRLDIVKFLKKNEAEIDAKNIGGSTPLHSAAYYGRLDVVKFLAKNGANIYAKDDTGNDPIHLAAWEDHLDIVKFLAVYYTSASQKKLLFWCKNKKSLNKRLYNITT
ncbi:ankyrin repeat domain-containing protein [Candidatus Dependentiae bacterium]